ncbi:chitin synthase-domain-containing protein [Dichotomocladium elegans]|nr:chitin synthase-domain-containing protein [Dichotomocladium elegans]
MPQLARRNTGPRRQRSLVRPERERIGANHRQYHYRQHAATTSSGVIAPSTTGNLPIEVERARHQVQMVRRGKSILGREEKPDDVEDARNSGSRHKQRCHYITTPAGYEGAVHTETPPTNRFWAGPHNFWILYCQALTCCVPSQLLTLFGILPGPAQMAWREKIGLLSFILLVMGFVGFLTFGFTQAVCPTPPLSVSGGEVSMGYLIIHGWAYMLADWDGHPAIPAITSEKTNILYPPVNGGGMDASLLFQADTTSVCGSILTAKTSSATQGIYFPCQLFNPNSTVMPDPNTYTNKTSCHTSSASNSVYSSFQTVGVPKSSGGFDKAARVYYNWNMINATSHLTVYNGDVLNLNLLRSLPTNHFGYPQGGLIEAILHGESSFAGMDISKTISRRKNGWEEEAKCLSAIIKVGSLDTLNIGCMASQIVLYVSLIVILGVIVTKFVLAVIFGWFLSWRLGNFNEGSSYAERMKRQDEIENWSRNITSTGPIPRVTNVQPNQQKKKSLLPQTSRFTQPQHGITRFDADRASTPAWKANFSRTISQQSFGTSHYPAARTHLGSSTSFYTSGDLTPRRSSVSSSDLDTSSSGTNTIAHCPFPLSPYVVRQPSANYMPFKFPLVHTVCLVTCYSEGVEGIRTTLDSLATSDYPNSHKLLFVICDGIVTGHGNTKSTPDACISMMRDFVIPPSQVQPTSYVAIADGYKQHNMAKVYAGYYKYNDATVDPLHQQRVPMITIVKCGTPEEATEMKPGNRGKRDSQIVLMQFMQKVIFDERMTCMEYELFNCIWRITGVTPDHYEVCLMVDADTKLYPDALSRLVSCCVKDPNISGLCGETKIANKTDSWVSMIQVFEYYISHHMSKAFESIFGGVTCLPGCFCMYRIKAPKGPNGYWVPVLANPDVVEHYSENVVDTLHKKNLLLLGEDRYLSTLMLKTFPNRKMMFVPQAVCKTVVPDSFKVLLSQRRRWINSTIHNLMELLFVHDLCGTFCFSMQFIVFMELVGTLALPAAISFTLYLIILACLGSPALIPLILLAMILGLPAVLIVMTSRKVVYVGWMLLYLLSLPIWNFVLPMYAYWHFDDFSWGDTRKVEGLEKESGNHGGREGKFDTSRITMKKWSEYEKARRTELAIEHNLPPPRFYEKSRKVDIFKEPLLAARRLHSRRTGSDVSSDGSEVPLTTTAFYPNWPSQTTTTIHPNTTVAESGPMGDRHGNSTATQLPLLSSNKLHWQAPSGCDWANPAPHHQPSEDEEEKGNITNSEEDAADIDDAANISVVCNPLSPTQKTTTSRFSSPSQSLRHYPPSLVTGLKPLPACPPLPSEQQNPRSETSIPQKQDQPVEIPPPMPPPHGST